MRAHFCIANLLLYILQPILALVVYSYRSIMLVSPLRFFRSPSCSSCLLFLRSRLVWNSRQRKHTSERFDFPLKFPFGTDPSLLKHSLRNPSIVSPTALALSWSPPHHIPHSLRSPAPPLEGFIVRAPTCISKHLYISVNCKHFEIINK